MRNPLIIWLLTHSMQEALPLAISSFSLTAFVYMRKEQNKGKVWGRMWWLCDALLGDVGTGNPWLSIVGWESWWLHGIGMLKCLFMSVGRFGGSVQQLRWKALDPLRLSSYNA